MIKIDRLKEMRPDLNIEVLENGLKFTPKGSDHDLYGDFKKVKAGEDTAEAEKELFKEMAKVLNDLAEDPARRERYIIRHTDGDYDAVGIKIGIYIQKG